MLQRGLFILWMVTGCAWAQDRHSAYADSLSAKGFAYLQKRFEANIYHPAKSKIYAEAWLKKAKSEKDNYLQLTLAYRAFAIYADKKLQVSYADSMIINAKRTGNDELIGTSFMSKGILLYNNNQHSKSLDNYLIADRYLIKSDNAALSFQVKYGIAQIKYYLGFYDEAISLYRECAIFFEEENDRAYLNSIHGLGLCYTRIGNYKLATETNELGIKQGKNFKDTGLACYFIHAEGINQCASGNYTLAIKKLQQALPQIIALHDNTNEALAYFCMGKSYWELKNYKTAVDYFKKVDLIFQKENRIVPDLRRGYEYLIDYSKKQNDTQLELYYINQLLKVDKLLSEDYRYLLKKTVKEYDTKELLNTKNAIEKTMWLTRIIGLSLVVLMGIAIIVLIRRNRRNFKLFKELMKRDTGRAPLFSDTIFEEPGATIQSNELEEQNRQQPRTANNGKPAPPDISKDIEEAIVKRLEKFEGSKRYLEKDMNLSKMASILHTNSKYVTKVVAKHRGKGTIEYITELKLDYIIEMLKTDSRYRNYTNKALGEEAGFKTTQNFTRAFKSYTGITPTYFSSKLKRATNTGNQD